jgi:hypothetical protein
VSRADLEAGLLALWTRRPDQGFDVDQLLEGGPLEEVKELEPAAALEQVTANVDVRRPIERFAATQALALGLHHGGATEVADPLRALAVRLLEPYVGDEAPDRGDQLLGAITPLVTGDPISQITLGSELSNAFGGALTADQDGPEVRLRGRAAEQATMLVELAAYTTPECRTYDGTVLVDGQTKDATLVDVEVCTSLPMDRCRYGIDPRHWPECNPLFLSVEEVGAPTKVGDGWAGVIQEKVGLGPAAWTYTTDLAVRYVEGTRVAVAGYDLAQDRSDDHRVSVDHGFLAATDEGSHRRVRVVKVYRIDSFPAAHSWACPLWSWQLAFSGWWCILPDSVRRLFKVWLRFGAELGDAAAAHVDLHRSEPVPALTGSSTRVEPAFLSESYSLSVPNECRPSYVRPGVVAVPAPATAQAFQPAPGAALEIVPGAPMLAGSHPTTVTKGQPAAPAVLEVGIDPSLPPRHSYFGHVLDSAGNAGTPFVICLDGLTPKR